MGKRPRNHTKNSKIRSFNRLWEEFGEESECDKNWARFWYLKGRGFE